MHEAMNVSLKWLKAPITTLLRFVIKVEAQGLVKQERETTIVTLGARAFSPALLFRILRLFYMLLIVLWLRYATRKHANKTRTTRVDGSSKLSRLRLAKSHLCVRSTDVRSTAVKRDRGVFPFI